MKKSQILFAILLAVIVFSCENKKQEKPETAQKKEIPEVHNAKNSLDYLGSYKGVLPCADCEGIETVIQLNPDETYTKQSKYLGKNQKIFEELGDYTWSEDGNYMTLEGIDSEPILYKVEENKLIMLDHNGEKIKGDLSHFYELLKQEK